MCELAHTGSAEAIFKLSGILSLRGANTIQCCATALLLSMGGRVILRSPMVPTFLEYHTCARYCAGYLQTGISKRDKGPARRGL